MSRAVGITHVDAMTIPEAKRLLTNQAIMHGYRQDTDRGSFEGELYRLQLPFATAYIKNPLHDPVPVPPTTDWVPEQTVSACEKYYDTYILGCATAADSNEEYTYAERINRDNQLEHVMQMLLDTPGTNQATIAVGAPEDAHIQYPACLRELHFKVVGGKLQMYTIWRSHDLYGGFGMNMVGLAYLLRDVAANSDLEPGGIFYASSGSHVYNTVIDMLQGGVKA